MIQRKCVREREREREMCGKLYQNWKRGKKAFLIIPLIRKDLGFFFCIKY